MNISFNQIENEELRAFIEELNPSFKIPLRAKVVGTLLDAAYAETQVEKQEKTRGAHVTGMNDGWSSKSKLKLQVMMFHADGKVSLHDC